MSGDFSDKLAALCAAEMAAASKDADRMGVMIERLAASLGFTVCVAARGRPEGIDDLLTGAEGYAHAEAVDKAPMVRFMNDPANAVRGPRP